MKAFLIAVLALAACGRDEVRTNVAESAPALTLAGVVRAPQTIALTAPANGPVIYAKRFAPGARVTAGETVAIIANDQVAFAIEQTNMLLKSAKADYDRARSRFGQRRISDGEFTAALMRQTLAQKSYDAAVRDASFLRIIAPAAGTLVVTKRIAPRAIVSAGTVLAEVATNGAPFLECAVTASERALLRPTQRIRFNPSPGLRPPSPRSAGRGAGGEGNGGTGRIADVGNARVIASIDGPTSIKPGTRVEVQVELPDS